MKPQHLSEEMIWLAQEMFLGDHYWIAYNSMTYELGEGDLYFFRSKQEAKDFAEDNISDYDDFKVIYATTIIDLADQLSYRNSIGGEVNNIDNSVKTNVMNEENLNDLKECLKYMGFGDKLRADLEHHIRQSFPEFVLKIESEFGTSKPESTLYFSKFKENGSYFFNHHEAKLKNDIGTLRQTFYVDNKYNVSLKEAFNLLEGRSVYKELTTEKGENYHAWLQLDFKQKEEDGNYRIKQFPAAHGYHLEGTLAKFPIKELENPEQKERVMMSLQKGNLQPVNMKIDGGEHRVFIRADLEQKTLTVYDYGATRPLSNDQKLELMIPEARQKLNGKEVSIEGEKQGKELKQDDKTNKQKNKQKEDDSLLSKKRTSKKKGLTLH